jgi:hypothetical protein
MDANNPWCPAKWGARASHQDGLSATLGTDLHVGFTGTWYCDPKIKR